MAEGGPLPPVDRKLLAQHERRIAERRREEERTEKETAMPNPAGDEDWDSRDDPPPREPKPTNPSKATDEDDPVFGPWYSAI